MNQTAPGPGAGPGTGTDQQAPHQQTPPPHQDLDRLRRSVSDRYVAGVAGGLGRHFNVDPTIVRVLLAVLTVFGGAGVLVYGVCWAFVPEENKERAAINVGSDARKILLLAAAAIAALLAVGDAFGGFDAWWPFAGLAVIVGVVLVARDRRNERRTPSHGFVPAPGTYSYGTVGGAAPAADPSSPVVEPGGTPYTPAYGAAYGAGAPTTAYQPPAPPAWQPPVAQPPLVPPHPKRTGIIWFWPTLALIAIALGVVGIIDSSHHVVTGVYPAVAVAITGVMLLIGSFVGRPGGLILIGVISTMVLSAATVLGNFDFDGRVIDESPRTAAAVQPEYEAHTGQITLDLTDVVDPTALAGREIDLHLNAGEIIVYVPKSLNVAIDADLGFAGGIRIPGYDGGGIEDSATRYVSGTPTTTTEALELDIDVRIGQITVERR